MIKSERLQRRVSGEALPKLGSRVIARDHEQIVKRGDAAMVPGGAETLVQSMKQAGRGRAILPEQAASGAGRKTIREGAQETMRAIAVEVTRLGMSARQSEEDFAGVDADAREIPAQAISGVQCDFQSASIAVFAFMRMSLERSSSRLS